MKLVIILGAYVAISIISTILLIIILYLLFYKTPKEMNTYRWLLINLQISVYVECVYWAGMFAPISEVYPIPHIYTNGLLYKFFGTSVKISWPIETCLHSFVAANLVSCIVYRYRQLCSLEHHWAYQYFVHTGFRNMNIGFYTGTPLVMTYFTYIGMATDAETRKEILKLDPKHIFPGDVATFSDYAYLWAASLLGSAVFGAFGGAFLAYDSNRILKTKAKSDKTAAMHKEAIIALIVQTFLMEVVSSITSFIMVTVHVISRGKGTFEPRGFLDSLIAVAVCFHGLKSICFSLSIVLVHKPYRSAMRDMICKQGTEVEVLNSNVSSDPAV